MIIKCIKSNSLRRYCWRRWQLQRAGIGIALERMGSLLFTPGGTGALDDDAATGNECGAGRLVGTDGGSVAWAFAGRGAGAGEAGGTVAQGQDQGRADLPGRRTPHEHHGHSAAGRGRVAQRNGEELEASGWASALGERSHGRH